MKTTLLSCIALICATWHIFADGTKHSWELVGSVPNSFGGTNDYVLIPESKIRDLANYQAAAAAIAGKRDKCSIFFWTDRANIPKSEWMRGANMQTLTATYERSPDYKAPHLRLACWLYPSVEAAKSADAFFMPGVKMPKTEETTKKPPDAKR